MRAHNANFVFKFSDILLRLNNDVNIIFYLWYSYDTREHNAIS